MRMGTPEKTRRGAKQPPRADAKGKPKHAAAGSVVGQLSPDIISTYFTPELILMANNVLETYAEELVEYNDLLHEFEKKQLDAEIGEGGSINITTELPTPPVKPLYQSQYWVDQLQETLSDASDYFQAKNGAWKVQANAARFERRMDEKYGIFRPFLKEHPELEQFVRSMQRKYSQGYFSPLRQGKSPIPKSTSVIVLFMMHRGNVHWQVTLLSTLFFLVGLQPWALVVVVAGAHLMLEGRKKRPRKPMTTHISASEPYYSIDIGGEDISQEIENQKKNEILARPVGKKLEDKENIDGSEYDTILLGHGPATLYTGALLSRAGRKVLVLSTKADASGCYTIENAPPSVMKEFGSVPFDIEGLNIPKISRQQALMAPALSTSTDAQGGVRFAKIGSAADGYTFEILSVPGMGVEGSGDDLPFALRADGTNSLMEDAALALGDGWPGLKGDISSSTTGIYAATCDAINATSNQFYLSKLLPDNVNGMRSASTYQETSIRYASSFLEKGFPLNAHTRSLMAAIGMKSENIKPSMTSMGAHVTNICNSLSGEGMYYPIGGPRALSHALATVIEQNGGRVVTQVPIASLVFEEESSLEQSRKTRDGDEIPPRCIGVKFADDRQVSIDPSKWKTHAPVVISMHGFVTTFIRLLPEDIRVKYKVPRGLPALSEQRPVFKIMFALDGSAEDLELTGADFYRLPGAALAQDEIDPLTGQVKPGEIGWLDDTSGEDMEIKVDDVNQDTTENPQESSVSRGKREKGVLTGTKKKSRDKFETGASWIHISFPSAKDPSFQSRHGHVSTCVVTIEADDDFVTFFDTKPKLYAIQKGKENSADLQRLVERVRKDLFENYPQLQGKIVHSQLLGPLHRGLSHNPERFAAKGVRPESPYPGLFVGGSDLTVESFNGSMVGGWLAANAVTGYNWVDYLFLQKNVTTDIVRYLDPPDVPDEEDLAVPYQVPEESDSKDE